MILAQTDREIKRPLMRHWARRFDLGRVLMSRGQADASRRSDAFLESESGPGGDRGASAPRTGRGSRWRCRPWRNEKASENRQRMIETGNRTARQTAFSRRNLFDQGACLEVWRQP